MYAGAVWSADYFCAAVWVNVVGGDSLRPTTISALFCLAFAVVASENRHWRPPAYRLPFLLTPLTFSNTGRRDKSRQQPVLRDFWLHVLRSTLAFITSLSLPNLSCHRNISFIRSITHVRRFGIHVFFLSLLLYMSASRFSLFAFMLHVWQNVREWISSRCRNFLLATASYQTWGPRSFVHIWY